MASLIDRHGVLPAEHHVPDLLTEGLKIVFCGTALGRVSAQNKAYYANPTNLFWRTLHQTGLTPDRIAPTDYARLLDYGIGLTDLCKRHYGNDSELPHDAFDVAALTEKIGRYEPAILAFTSKTAASIYLRCPTGRMPLGLQSETINQTRLFVLPSPSGQARKYWNPDIWQVLKSLAIT